MCDASAAIRKGWAAHTNPDTYRDMGHDPDALYTAALRAIARRYKLPWSG